MTRPRSEETMALAALERKVDALMSDVTRMRNLKGFMTEIKPLCQRELDRLAGEIRALGGRPQKITL